MEATLTAPAPAKVETTSVDVSEPEVKVSAEEVVVAEPVVEAAAAVEVGLGEADVGVAASGPAVPEAEIGGPAIESSTPDVTAAAPGVEASAPAIEASLPDVTAAAPTVAGPSVEASAPSVETSLPEVTATAPEVEGKAPAIESSVPDMTAAVPAVAAPTVDVDAPVVEASVPDVAVAAPTIEVDAPVVEASVPDVAAAAPEVAAPNIEVDAPAVKVPVPDANATAPQVADPTVDVGVPAVGASVPTKMSSKVSDSRMNSAVEEETEARKVPDVAKLAPASEVAGGSVAAKIEKFSSDVVITEASPLVASEAATKSTTTLVVADGVDVSALKNTTQVEELARAVSALPDPLTLFLGEFLFLLLLNVVYAPLLKSWLLRLLIPPLLLATAASAAFWRTKHEHSEANLQKLNDEERRKVAEFEQQLQERAQGLKDREKALIVEEEKLRAVRDKLQARIGLARVADTAPETMDRGLTLSDNNKIELPGQPQNQLTSTSEPPALADLTIKLDKNMKQLGQHAYETFAERAEVLRTRSALGFDSNTQEMSKEQLRERSKAQSQGIFMSFVGQIRPQAVAPQLPRPNKKLLMVKGMEDITASADQARLADG